MFAWRTDASPMGRACGMSMRLKGSFAGLGHTQRSTTDIYLRDRKGGLAEALSHGIADNIPELRTSAKRQLACKVAERGIRTPLGCPKPDFESGAFDHSAISPR